MTALKKPQEITAPFPLRTSLYTSTEERRRLFVSFLDRFQKNRGLTRPEAVQAMSVRLGPVYTLIYQWLSESLDPRSISWEGMDLLHYEEHLLENGIDFGADILSFYQTTEQPAPYIPPEDNTKLKLHRPFQTFVWTSNDERRRMFRAYVNRMELRHGLTRPEVVTAMSIRLGRMPGTIYQYLSNATRNRGISGIKLDVLLYEEHLTENNIDFGEDILSLYSKADSASPAIPSAA